MTTDQKTQIADLIESIIEDSKTREDAPERLHHLGYIERKKGKYRVYLSFVNTKMPIKEKHREL